LIAKCSTRTIMNLDPESTHGPVSLRTFDKSNHGHCFPIKVNLKIVLIFFFYKEFRIKTFLCHEFQTKLSGLQTFFQSTENSGRSRHSFCKTGPRCEKISFIFVSFKEDTRGLRVTRHSIQNRVAFRLIRKMTLIHYILKAAWVKTQFFCKSMTEVRGRVSIKIQIRPIAQIIDNSSQDFFLQSKNIECC
jgi:hypothetical protein